MPYPSTGLSGSAWRAPFDITYHTPLPSGPYVNHVAKRMLPWCVMLTPQPDSLFAGECHQRAWKLSVDVIGGPLLVPMLPVEPAKLVAEFVTVVPSRLSDNGAVGSAPWLQTSEPSP